MRAGDEIANRFRLEHPLGSGGMGTVWAATHLKTHKSVALKFLHAKHADADGRKRALREARAACAVQHPNVATVHDVIENTDGSPILVMDLLRGESLAQKLEREGTLAPIETIAMITPVLRALTASHASGVVHRDLKPGNIFLVGGDARQVQILDFGVAKLAGTDVATRETSRLTETGVMIGTPQYMAPEQAFGEQDIDARADLWSVGAVLYECLAGTPPTAGDNLGQILKVLAVGTIVPLATRAPSVPAGLAAIVDGLLRIDKSERPPSADVVLEQLAAFEAHRDVAPAVAKVHGNAPPKGPLRTWLGLTVGGAAAVSVAFFFFVSRARPREAPRQITTAESVAPPVATPSPSVDALPVPPTTASALGSAPAPARTARPTSQPGPSSRAKGYVTPLINEPRF